MGPSDLCFKEPLPGDADGHWLENNYSRDCGIKQGHRSWVGAKVLLSATLRL